MECWWWFSGEEDSKAKTGRMRKVWKCMGTETLETSWQVQGKNRQLVVNSM